MFKRLRGIFAEPGVLYHPSCFHRNMRVEENYKIILNLLGISHVATEEEKFVKCGYPLLDAGYEVEFIKLARKNLEYLKQKNINKIICSCPECYKVLSQDYRKLLPDFDIKVEFISSAILGVLRKKPRKIKSIPDREESLIVYHDPCYLSRYTEIYQEPLELLNILGFRVVNPKYHGEDSMCCGAGGLLKETDRELADEIAKKRLSQLAERGVRQITSMCSICAEHLAENSRETELEIVDISELLAKALKIRLPEDETEEKSDRELEKEVQELDELDGDYSNLSDQKNQYKKL